MRLLLKDSTLIKLLAKLSANNIMLTAHLFSSFFVYLFICKYYGKGIIIV